MTSFTMVLTGDPASLFPYLADPKNRADWQSSIVSLDVPEQGLPRAGMRWRECARGFGCFEMEMTECRPFVSWAEHGYSDRGVIDLRLLFDEGPRAGTTALTVELTLKLSGIMRIGQEFAPWVLRPLLTRDLRRAARLVAASGSKVLQPRERPPTDDSWEPLR